MGHTPYGYRIENGSAVIVEREANCIRQMFQNYLDGMSLREAGKSAGYGRTHSQVKRVLSRSYYCGDDFYPPIIDKALFRKVNAEIRKRSAECSQLEKTRRHSPAPLQDFVLGISSEQFNDPYEQAEYIYSLIESKVISCQK
jgi:hypothetical protein